MLVPKIATHFTTNVLFFISFFWCWARCQKWEKYSLKWGRMHILTWKPPDLPGSLSRPLIPTAHTVADLGFPQGGGTNSPGGHQHMILPKFPKNCMKFKEFRPQGACIPCAPLRSTTDICSCHKVMLAFYSENNSWLPSWARSATGMASPLVPSLSHGRRWPQRRNFMYFLCRASNIKKIHSHTVMLSPSAAKMQHSCQMA